jgi:hypothetical protein
LYGRNEEDDDDEAAVIVCNATSPSLSYPYFEIPSTSEATTALTSISTKEIDMLNYVDTSNGYTGLEEYEAEPFLCDDNDVVINHLEVDHYNYLQNSSKEASTILPGVESALIV